MAATTSWVPADAKGDFSIHNLPFGIFSTSSGAPRAGVRIGDSIVDLKALSSDPAAAGLKSIHGAAASFAQPTLNAFAESGRATHKGVRAELQAILGGSDSLLQSNDALKQKVLVPVSQAKMHLPMQIGDYTDFYAGYNHAFKVGVLFRGPDNALQPNYTHIPVGYHGRSSSIVVSGTPIQRPRGQILPNPAAAEKIPVTAACKRFDYELELAAFICKPTQMGDSVDVNEADEYIFGYVLLNDWSARDIQAWEYIPLGPFNGKNFGSTISPWIVTGDALEPFRTEPLENKTAIQPYLQQSQKKSVYDIKLQTTINTNGKTDGSIISETSAKNLLWSFPQMVAHHTYGGCNLRAGDMLGSGTISGTELRERGSLLEMTEGGKQDFEIGQGKVRRFLEDGDSVVMYGYCEKEGIRVGFGDCEGTILPAKAL
ncbi:fumarylacetoacetase [Cordyceps militaris CM01]|uniref:Fumarylacetoacetase n=2 Tax=Cordyceps militaris TaxID=73501 RepID=G3JF21_CORMM|nr:fumarylacetoacetase [Cordyceps militaris CM01]ATY64137.1 fumarylacetoacetase [Cordyceps militaris]EGX93077.1 fumarylacetoacetase [Cordyceps militaris CM01]